MSTASSTGSPSSTPSAGGVFPGWVVVASVFILLLANSGFGFYGLAIYLDAITAEQGFTTGSVSFATSIYFVVSAIAGRMIAPVIERRDIRQVVAAGAVISALGLWLIGMATSLGVLYLAYVVFAIGNGLSGLVPATTLITRWFHARRSVALSVASTGLSMGGLTLTLLVDRLIDRSGMAGAAPWLALMYVLIVAVVISTLWPNPESRGSTPDGLPVTGPAAAPSAAGTSYADAIASPFFRIATVAFILTMGAQVGGIAQIAKLGTERIDDSAGALAISGIAFTSVLARLAGGWVATRIPLITMTWVLAGVQSGALLWISVVDTRSQLLAAVVVFGATIGNLLMLQPLLVADRFGVREYPRIFALQQLIVTGFGVAVGPYLLGILHDLSSYRLSYIVAGAMSLAGSMLFFAASRRIDQQLPSEAF